MLLLTEKCTMSRCDEVDHICSGKLGKWLLVARWEITQLKMYERELLAAKEQLEGAVCKQKLALRSIDFGLIYIDRNYLVQWERDR